MTATPPGGGTSVTCHRLIHIYSTGSGDVVALSGVDLHIAAGEMLALVGPSGSGKSTLVAILGGLMRSSAGRVYVGEHELSRLSSAQLAALRGTVVGTVLQGAERNLLPYVSLWRNIWLAQRPAARLAGRRLDPPEAILDLVGLAGAGKRHTGELTPGQRQRAALAQGLAARPGLLLVDEPTSQLDGAGRDEVLAALETINSERGTTVVVVTHDGQVGARLGRAVTIRDGRVGAEGRDGRDFAVVAGDGTIQLPPETVSTFPPGTLFAVEHTDRSVTLVVNATPVPPPRNHGAERPADERATGGRGGEARPPVTR
ncbi:ABC transporter ATP-binding protein [Micromonospora sp. DT47]|uniref:ABC transporter ATP-binding protein n=1 Tax=Micromonospora sp. DT47 TaxID=3393431 RepID=UPI003CF41FDE